MLQRYLESEPTLQERLFQKYPAGDSSAYQRANAAARKDLAAVSGVSDATARLLENGYSYVADEKDALLKDLEQEIATLQRRNWYVSDVRLSNISWLKLGQPRYVSRREGSERYEG